MKKEKWLTGFKLLEKRDGRLRSWNSKDESFLYSTRFVTTPPKRWGPMAVFDSLYAANNYREHMNSCRGRRNWPIYRCQYIKSRAKRMYCPDMKFWGNIPQGTVLASKVKLTRRVA